MDDLISRQAAIALAKDICVPTKDGTVYKYRCIDPDSIKELPSCNVIYCKDCFYGHLCIDVRNGVEDSWIECRNPEGLYRDVSVDGYCSASIKRGQIRRLK